MENNPAVENAVVETQNGTTAAPETTLQTLADVIGAEVAEKQPEPQTEEPQQPHQEPGYVKDRIQKAQRKWEASHQEELDRLNNQVASLTERLIQMDAEKLVADGEFKSMDRAVKYLRMEAGLPVDAGKTETPRDEKGRFIPKEPEHQDAEPASGQPKLTKEQNERVEMLARQADSLKEKRGIDVMEIFKNDPQVKEKVLKGEWDFHDVYYAELDKQVNRVPAPTRASNGVALGNMNLRTAKSSDIHKLDEFLARGGVVNMR